MNLKIASAMIVGLAFFLVSCSPKPPAHGTVFVIALDTNQIAEAESASQLLLHNREVLQNRLNRLGIRFFIEPVTGERLVVKVSRVGPQELELVRRTLSTLGLIEFRMVHPESDQLVAQGIIEPGYEILRQEIRQADGSKGVASYLVNKKPERGLTGKYIKRAMATRHPVTNEPEIDFELDAEGAKIFEQITTQYSPKANRFFHLAIVFDRVLYSAPRIMGPIPGGRGQISGGSMTPREAYLLASVLENPLEASLRIVEEKSF